MIKQLFASAAILASLSLGACASAPGNFNGLGQDGMSMVVVHKNPYTAPMTANQYGVVVKVAASCLRDVHRQTASVFEVMATNGAADAIGGAGGEAAGYKSEAMILGSHLAKNALPAVAAFGAAANGVQGVVNGAKIKSSVVTNIVGNCTNGDLHDAVLASRMSGVHVYGSQVRTNNSSHRLPSWVQKVNAPASTATQPGDAREPDPEMPNN